MLANVTSTLMNISAFYKAPSRSRIDLTLCCCCSVPLFFSRVFAETVDDVINVNLYQRAQRYTTVYGVSKCKERYHSQALLVSTRVVEVVGKCNFIYFQ